jgi:uncharacterized protein YqiB (DUF1249 family)
MSTVKYDMLKRMLARRSFPGLMDLYENNFRQICRLVPAMDELQGWAASRVAGHPDLYLHIEERCKFTTTLVLTYLFETADGEQIKDPELYIRVYHDARQAEVMSCRKDGFMALQHVEGERPAVIDCKWDSNLFLTKWLEYSLELGHVFGEGSMLDEDIEADRVMVDV